MTTLLALMLLLTQSPSSSGVVEKLDPNTATKAQLLALDPLITPKVADSIIDLRPYATVDRVRRAVTSEVWEKIQSKLFLQAGEVTPPRVLAQSPQPPRQCTTRPDINTASKEELVKVEGIIPDIADAIMGGRPYTSFESVHRRMPKEVWEKVMFKLCLEKTGPQPTAPLKEHLQRIAR